MLSIVIVSELEFQIKPTTKMVRFRVITIVEQRRPWLISKRTGQQALLKARPHLAGMKRLELTVGQSSGGKNQPDHKEAHLRCVHFEDAARKDRRDRFDLKAEMKSDKLDHTQSPVDDRFKRENKFRATGHTTRSGNRLLPIPKSCKIAWRRSKSFGFLKPEVALKWP